MDTAQQEVFTYVIVDGDGDGQSAQLIITVDPSAVPTITGDSTQDVFEAGLPPRGSEPAGSAEAADGNPNNNTNTTEAVSGTFTIASPDGLTSITITPDGTDLPVTITLAQLLASSGSPVTVETVEGKLVVNGYNSGTGVVSYTYTLDDNQNHSGGPITDTFQINATDPNLDTSAPFSLTVTINDDVPTAVDDMLQSIAENAIGTIGGNVTTNDLVGADGAQLTHVDLGAGLVAITSGTPLGSGVFQHSNTYGVYTFKADGTWTFDPNANLTISGLTGLEASFNYRLTDGDTDLSNTALQPIKVLDGVSFSIDASPTSISEEAAGVATFTLSVTGFPLNAGNTASVDLAASGTADGTDYTPSLLASLAGVLPAGVTLVGSTLTFTSAYEGSPIVFTVTVIDDSLVEGSETIIATLTNQTILEGTATIGAASDTVTITEVENTPLVIDGAVSGTVEEEHGLPGGIDDATSGVAPDADADIVGTLTATTNGSSGSFLPLVTGGIDGTLNFAFASLAGNPAVQTVSNGALLADGKPVLFAMDGANLIGFVNSDGGTGPYDSGSDTKIFTITLNSAGDYTFTLNAPIDHPINSPSTEDTIAINLNGRVTLTDPGGPAADTNVPLNASIVVIDDVPELGTIGSITVENGPGTQTAAFPFQAGADGVGTVDFTPPTTALSFGGVAIQYTEVNNVLIAHTGNQGDPVFTLTLNLSTGTYSFQQFKPLDGEITTTGIDGSTAQGTGPQEFVVLNAGGTDLAVLSGWQASSGFTGTFTQDSVKGSTAGWGVGNGQVFDGNDFFRFDFQDADTFGGAFTPPPGFSGPVVTTATYEFTNFGGGTHTIQYKVYYSTAPIPAPRPTSPGAVAHSICRRLLRRSARRSTTSRCTRTATAAARSTSSASRRRSLWWIWTSRSA
ncbi:beta strand repeat-containing protein [Bradyrhizobium sp. TZ2]